MEETGSHIVHCLEFESYFHMEFHILSCMEITNVLITVIEIKGFFASSYKMHEIEVEGWREGLRQRG